MEVAGKAAVITGAASGIGRAVAVGVARRNVRDGLVDMGENIGQVV
jgi:NAD(P)-dependent dehydrogenase (short-subunit alcohol dehydrogenase family)